MVVGLDAGVPRSSTKDFRCSLWNHLTSTTRLSRRGMPPIRSPCLTRALTYILCVKSPRKRAMSCSDSLKLKPTASPSHPLQRYDQKNTILVILELKLNLGCDCQSFKRLWRLKTQLKITFYGGVHIDCLCNITDFEK